MRIKLYKPQPLFLFIRQTLLKLVVNRGGWFVLEVRCHFNYIQSRLPDFLLIQPWITPGIFEDTGNDDIVDEYTFGQLLNSSYAQNILQRHWDTWIIEDDFKAIKAAGLTHVRSV